MRVLRGFWKLLVAVKDGLVLLVLLLFFGGLFALLSMRPNPAIPSNGALLVRLDGALVEQPAGIDPLTLLAGNNPATHDYRLRDVVHALRVAARDDAVKAVVLDLDGFTGGGQVAIDDVGAALDGVRAAGKPVFAYATGYADDGYQLAAHASEVWLDPIGAVLLAGPGGAHLYYKGLLDKLGVTVHVYRVGRFKSAVEPFILTHASPDAKAANQALADALWASWQADVRRARPQAQVAAYAADPSAAIARAGGDNAEGALKAGLVDRLGDRLAFGQRVAAVAGGDPRGLPGGFAAIPLDHYLAAHPFASGGKVGVLTVAGDIVDGEHGPGSAGGETVSRLLLEALAKHQVKALVVRVDSPGGSVTASERIRNAIMVARRQGLPVVVSMGSVAASGGYWVSTAGTTIFAEPATITGSIGVFGMIPTFQGTLAKLGLSADGVTTTPLSGQPDVYRGTSAAFDTLIQASIDDIYRRFTGLVAQARGLTPARVDEIGQGRVWAGGVARKLGLVDRFGSLDDAIAFAAGEAHLSNSDARPFYIENKPSFVATLLANWAERSGMAGDGASLDPLTRFARRPESLLARALGDAAVLAKGPAVQVRCLVCGVAEPEGAPQRPAPLGRLLLERLIG